MLRTALLPAIALFSLAALACSGDDAESPPSPSPISVVATTTQIGDFAAQVGGDRIDLTVLLTPGQDAHDFEMEPSQIRAISEADLVLRNGLDLDSFVDKSLEDSSAAVVTVSSGIETIEGGHAHEDGDDHDEDEDQDEEHEDVHDDEEHSDDPHIWFSVDNARRMVENTRDALVAEDAANRDFYTTNAAAYFEELDGLDTEIHAAVETVPEACRKLVSNHDVFRYYAAAYGFEVIGSVIPATTTAAQASAADIAAIATEIREQNIPAIFAETSASPDLVNQVGREAGVMVVDDLYGDSLGAPGSDGSTYIEMMRANTNKIVGALKDCQS